MFIKYASLGLTIPEVEEHEDEPSQSSHQPEPSLPSIPTTTTEAEVVVCLVASFTSTPPEPAQRQTRDEEQVVWEGRPWHSFQPKHQPDPTTDPTKRWSPLFQSHCSPDNFHKHKLKRQKLKVTGTKFAWKPLNRKEFLLLVALGCWEQGITDNFYTSPKLFNNLDNKKMLACGTVREARRGFPNTKINKLARKSKWGDIKWLRSGKLLFL